VCLMAKLMPWDVHQQCQWHSFQRKTTDGHLSHNGRAPLSCRFGRNNTLTCHLQTLASLKCRVSLTFFLLKEHKSQCSLQQCILRIYILIPPYFSRQLPLTDIGYSRNWEELSNGYRISVWADGNFLEMDIADGCPTLRCTYCH